MKVQLPGMIKAQRGDTLSRIPGKAKVRPQMSDRIKRQGAGGSKWRTCRKGGLEKSGSSNIKVSRWVGGLWEKFKKERGRGGKCREKKAKGEGAGQASFTEEIKDIHAKGGGLVY